MKTSSCPKGENDATFVNVISVIREGIVRNAKKLQGSSFYVIIV